MPRPYRSKDHLRDVIASDAGRIAVSPQEADRIVFDIASANSMPANLPTSDYNGSSVLDIGHGVQVRASGYARLAGTYAGAAQWAVDGALHASQYPSHRDLTAAQEHRARAIIGELITAWAATHGGDIAQADDIDRNNAARTLEENIARHTEALKILRRNLRRCENGQTHKTYPDLPTKGR